MIHHTPKPAANRSAWLLGLAALGYLAALVAVDSRNDILGRVGEVLYALPVLLVASSVSYLVRYLRWHILLQQLGHAVPFGPGLLVYIAGFAFTATPGKVGELVRLRYLARYGIPPERTIACFVFERMLDLLTLLLFASLLARSAAVFLTAAAFVALVLVAVLAVARWRRIRLILQTALRLVGWRRPARWLRILLRGVEQTAVFLPLRRLVPAIVLGVAGWGIQCVGYAITLAALGITLAPWLLFAIPPAAILVGAASMLPGGIGTTEAATVALLAQHAVPLELAVLGAIAIRVGSLWFATILGLCVVFWLEQEIRKDSAGHYSPLSAG